MTRIETLKHRLSNKEIILLDGATGTELQRRGVRTELPLWSASALITHPNVVQQIHKDYIDAGADIITTNTFRTSRRALSLADQSDKVVEYNRIACELAKAARDSSDRNDVVIGGCIAPLEDCYKPNLVPHDEALEIEHAEHAVLLARYGADFIFAETMNCIREGSAVLRAGKNTGLPVAISIVCHDAEHLLSGEKIIDAINAFVEFEPLFICANCRPLKTIDGCVSTLLKYSNIPIGVYANGLGHPHDEQGWLFEGGDAMKEYIAYSVKWLEQGVQVIGGCCGTTPKYIAGIAKHLSKNILFQKIRGDECY
ncbi:MAG TPA: homocysteine S-methyltransferase family protein [Candidatus Peribacterales bacterium]|nr:homocysteine S-methyltransferase family protein [Candidatus Peribacterales bacterium]